ncbi:MAG: M48 family metallopeptidase [Prolixibacteraceae bacterium]|nr:M48 family metallopeptidase [Prolixibacteraceae bacterium]
MSTKTFYHEGIGQVNITRRKGAKNISMRIKPEGIVQVTHPWYANGKEVVNFILDHIEWIKKQQKKIAERKITFAEGEVIPTKFRTIHISKVPRGKLQAVLDKTKVVLTVPSAEDIYSERVQKFISRVVTEVCRDEAKIYLPRRVFDLAEKHGFSFNKVFIKNLKSKWGSCSSAGNINLNLHLMRLPDHLIDYLILHELAHTKEMNHGRGFKKLMNELTNGQAKQLEKEMKEKSRTLLNLP